MEPSDAAVEEVVVFTSSVVPEARRALAALQRLHETGGIRLSACAVVGRRQDGCAFAVEQTARSPSAPVASDAAAVMELLTGPFGVVLENAPDALVGSLVDIADLDKADRLLRCFGPAVPAGCVATIALVAENRPDAVEAMAGRLGASLTRRLRHEVETDLGGPVAPAPRSQPAAGRSGHRALARMKAALTRGR